MENNQPFNNYDRLLIEYIRLLDSTNNTTRTAQTSFLTILHSYLNTLNSQLERQHTTNANVRSLLQRYFENFRTQQYENRNADRIRQRHNQNLRRRNNIWNLNNNTGDSYSLRQNNVIPNSTTTNTATNTNTGSTLFSDPFFSRRSTERPFSFNFSNTENTNTTSNTLRRNRPSDLFNTRNTRRRHTGTSPLIHLEVELYLVQPLIAMPFNDLYMKHFIFLLIPLLLHENVLIKLPLVYYGAILLKLPIK